MERTRAARIVGVELAATPDQVRDAYRRRSRELHPDTGRGDAAAMAELNDAYETLRARTGMNWEFSAPPSPEPSWTAAPFEDSVSGGGPSPLRLFAISLAVVTVVATTVVFIAAVGYDWSLSP